VTSQDSGRGRIRGETTEQVGTCIHEHSGYFASMVSRERILEAAARVYAKHGFKGATTRLIAIEAGVNEVTLFRTFGSKGALLHAVLSQHVSELEASMLPADPANPRTELRAYIRHTLEQFSEMRPLLMHTMSEIDDRPEAHEFACRGKQHSHDTITTYFRHLQRNGWADPTVDIEIVALMLNGSVISDVMGRALVPAIYPPLAEVADRYTTVFLRALGIREDLMVTEQTPRYETWEADHSVGSSERATNTSSDTHS
jgi:AcrR family transcriptional regulator